MTFKRLLIMALVVVFVISFQSSALRLILVDSKEDPGTIKVVDLNSGQGRTDTIYTRPSGNINAATCSRYGIYFADGQDIFLVNSSAKEHLIHHHESLVRDLKVRELQGTDRLYFSDATGAGGNGIIYYVDEKGVEVPYYNVGYTMKLTDVAGFWDGNFAFDGEDKLYLSNGDHVPSSIYRISGAGPDKVSGALEKVYTDTKAPILGLYCSGDKGIYYVDGKAKLYKIDLNLNDLKKEALFLGSYGRLSGISQAFGAMVTGKFVASKGSDKYHLPGCPWARKIVPENEVWFSSPEEARANGHEPCKSCNPPSKSQSPHVGP